MRSYENWFLREGQDKTQLGTVNLHTRMHARTRTCKGNVPVRDDKTVGSEGTKEKRREKRDDRNRHGSLLE